VPSDTRLVISGLSPRSSSVETRDGSFVDESFKMSDSLMRAVNDSLSLSERIVRRTNEECHLVNDAAHLPLCPLESQTNIKNVRKESLHARVTRACRN
jgi:hypothetical protein